MTNINKTTLNFFIEQPPNVLLVNIQQIESEKLTFFIILVY